MEGELDNAFCAVRPPGHHAERDRAMGFCFFNNVALGAVYLLENFGLERVAIVDWDVHHGNGTQHLFESRPPGLLRVAARGPAVLLPRHRLSPGRGQGAGQGLSP